ncbi:MAG: TrmH family RNA methyltransferase [Treponema sp.]
MIEFFKLKTLNKKQRIHKVLKLLELSEHSILDDEKTELLDAFYLKQLFDVIFDDVDEHTQEKIKYWADNPLDETKRTIINAVRHSLYNLTGYSPSEWDLILPFSNLSQDELKDFSRFYFKNLFLYAEDIRTPFNIGSIFRTAESFGVEKIFLSEHCISPENPKAQRVSMGTIDYLDWEQINFENLPKLPIIALETGGEDINKFCFPREGIAVVGNEELGISAEMLKKADAVVSIPMYGIKASINVSVAFGILMQKWTESIIKEN